MYRGDDRVREVERRESAAMCMSTAAVSSSSHSSSSSSPSLPKAGVSSHWGWAEVPNSSGVCAVTTDTLKFTLGLEVAFSRCDGGVLRESSREGERFGALALCRQFSVLWLFLPQCKHHPFLCHSKSFCRSSLSVPFPLPLPLPLPLPEPLPPPREEGEFHCRDGVFVLSP